jgi:general secretion pathway protein D
MKTYRPWALALALALPALALPKLTWAADQSTTSRVASSSEPDYQSIDISELVERVAKRTGKQFIMDPRVRAGIPLVGLDVAQIDYARLLAILTVHQYAAYESNGVVKIVPDAISRQLPIPVTTEISPQTLDDEFVTVMYQGKNMCTAHSVPVLRPLMPQNAHLAAFPQANMLLISDRAANARRIIDMAERLDKGTPSVQKCPPEMLPSKPDAKK